MLYSIFATLSAGSCATEAVTPFNPGFRNEFHAGLGQSIGRHFVIDAEYIWKYTHNAYDFSVLGTTPITFPIEWHNSKIPGFALRAALTDLKGLSVRFNAIVGCGAVLQSAAWRRRRDAGAGWKHVPLPHRS